MRGFTYNEGTLYRLIPVHRFGVVPGETVQLDGRLDMMSQPLKKAIMSGGQMVVGAFYVPYRLLWDGWIDFVVHGNLGAGTPSAPGGATELRPAAIPSTQVPWALIFEDGGGNPRSMSVFGRRAFKLIYNQYFGDQNLGNVAWYDDILDDADVSQKRTRNLDQLLSNLIMRNDTRYAQQNYTVPVTGAQGLINLDEFRAALVRSRAMKRRDMTGDKYVDALMGMGVKLDWRVQNAPECLGIWKTDVAAPYNRSTAGDTTGKTFSQYRASAQVKTGKKFFAEHGAVFIVAVSKVALFHQDQIAPEALILSKNMMYFGDNQVGTLNYASDALAEDQGVVMGRQFEYLHQGRNIAGYLSQNSWVPLAQTDALPALDDFFYPDNPVDQYQAPQQLDGGGLAYGFSYNHRLLLPFGKNII